DSAAGVQREHRRARGKAARQRRRKNRNAGERRQRLTEHHEARPHFRERTDTSEARPGGDAEQRFDAALAERAEVPRIEIEVLFGTEQRRRTPREPDAAPDIGAVEFSRDHAGELAAKLKAMRVRLRRSLARPEQEEKQE